MRTVEQTDRRDETNSRFWQFCECAYKLNGEKYKVLLMSNKKTYLPHHYSFLGEVRRQTIVNYPLSTM